MFLSARTVVFPVQNLKKARTWYTKLLGFEPEVVESSYIQFNGGGYELGVALTPQKNIAGQTATTVYWRVNRIEPSLTRLLGLGCVKREEIHYVTTLGLMASVIDPFGNRIGLVEERNSEPRGY